MRNERIMGVKKEISDCYKKIICISIIAVTVTLPAMYLLENFNLETAAILLGITALILYLYFLKPVVKDLEILLVKKRDMQGKQKGNTFL